jgi:parallel beta-helix repeat protein
MKKLLLTLILTFSLPGAAWGVATTYHVAQSGGSDSNTCAQAQTVGTAKATINAGLDCLTADSTPGDDTLLIRAGTYEERWIDNDVPNGTAWDKATTIKNYNNEVVILKPTGTSRIINYENGAAPIAQYHIYDGLIFDGSNKTISFLVNIDGITGLAGSGTTIRFLRFINCTFRWAKASAVLTGRGANFLEFKNSKFHDNGTNIGDHGLYLESSDSLIEGNEAYNNSGFGFHVFSSITNDSVNRNLVTRNYAHHNGSGIVMGPGAANVASYNIVTNDIREYAIAAYNGCSNCKIIHNTVYGNTGDGIQARSGSSNAIITNNISYNNTGADLIEYNTTTKTAVFTNNLCDAAATNCAIVSGTVGNVFVDAAGGNFGLVAGSAAINAGANVTGFAKNGTLPDVGAFETLQFSSALIADTATDKTMVINFLGDAAPPLLPATGCLGFSAKKNGNPNAIVSCARTGTSQMTLTLTDAYTSSDTAQFSYLTASGNVSDSRLIGNMKNQRLNALTDQTATTAGLAGGGGSTPLLTQVSFGFESFGGTEATPDYFVGTNRNAVIPPNTCIVLRGQISCTVADCPSIGAAIFARKNGSGSYTAVNNGPCPSTGICYATGTGLLPPERMAGPTTEKLGGAGTFVTGGVQPNAFEVPSVSLTAGQDTEFVVPVCVGSGNSAGEYFDLRWYKSGAALDSYTLTPRLFIGSHDARSGKP